MAKKYYEIELRRLNNFSDSYSICIIGTRKPSKEEAEEFLKEDIKNLEYDIVTDVLEIDKNEAYQFFDMKNEKDFPIFK